MHCKGMKMPMLGGQHAAVGDDGSGGPRCRRLGTGAQRRQGLVIGSLLAITLACIGGERSFTGRGYQVAAAASVSQPSTSPGLPTVSQANTGRVLNVRDFGALGT